ncbi:DsbC family protein [Neisseriaceae bacterium ESL0693]|nr:DsbC family protein [Neisseriaceae bacterium ESL0693]
MPLYRWLASLCLMPLLLTACDQTAVKTHDNQASAETQTSKEVQQGITAKLQKVFASQDPSGQQQLQVLSIRKTPLADLYEVVVNDNQILYTDAKGDYMILGNLVDLNTQENLTKQRTKELNHMDFKQLPFDKAIKEVRGNGQRKLAVFSDPDCPFCKKLEQEIGTLDNVTIYTFLMPLTELHPQAQEKAEQIWCQPNRTEAWVKWMRQGIAPAPVAQCKTPVADTLALGTKAGFNGTPTLVFPDGETISGLIPAAELNQILDAKQQ